MIYFETWRDVISDNIYCWTEGEKIRDISFLTSLPGASEKLHIFHADLNQPESFNAAIEGCTGVFHVAHPVHIIDKEPEETETKRAVNAAIGILKTCLASKTEEGCLHF